MAQYSQDWDDLGRNIQDIVDKAINSQDYQRLSQTVRQAVERAVDQGGETVRRVVENATGSAPRTRPTRPRIRQNVVPERDDRPVLYGKTGKITTKGILKVVGGGVLSLTNFVGVLLYLLLPDTSILSFPMGLMAAGLGGGVWLLSSGIRTLGWVSHFKSYRKTLGNLTHCTLEKLARSVGKSVKYVRKELNQMIDQGLFLEGHLDKEETSLITSHETYRYYEQSRLQMERQQQVQEQKAAQPRDARVQEVLDRGSAFITQIRRCNDAIPGEEISGKISRMELIVEKIFERAEAHPEIVPDLKKLMDYYLPMTVKLLNAYADMDAQPIQGETIVSSKREIEQTLDTLNVAFEKLLDSVFMDTAMDVSSDISVLHTLLAQEGLTEDELTKMKKQQ